MNTRYEAEAENEGQQVYVFGKFWPIAFARLNQRGGSALVPDHLWLIEGDRLMIALGDLPTIPAWVMSIDRDMVQLEFCQPLDKSVLRLTGYSGEDELLAAA